MIGGTRMLFYRDGQISDRAIAPFDLTDRGLLLGDGVFDTALVLGGRMFRREAHLARFFHTLSELGIDADPKAVRLATEALVARGGEGVLRTTVTRGPGPRGLRPRHPQTPTVFASLSPLPTEAFFAPLTLEVATIRRNETSPTSRLKTLNYLDSIIAASEAVEKGFDEALFLNLAGRVACVAAGNIFALYGREIVTPPVTDGALPGIVRGFILDECGGRERSLDLAGLLAADAIFVTNSLRLIAPIIRVDDTMFGSGTNRTVGELQRRLQKEIGTECGVTLPILGGGAQGEWGR